jgi:integrase
MPRACASAPAAEPPAARPRRAGELAAGYAAHLAARGRGCRSYRDAASRFLGRWPNPQTWAEQPLPLRLAADSATRPLVTHLMLAGALRPGYDYLAHRRIPGLLEQAQHGPLAGDLARYGAAAVACDYTAHVIRRSSERVVARLLIQTGRALELLSVSDLDELRAAFRDRADARGKDWSTDRHLVFATHTVLYHLGILASPPGDPRRAAGLAGYLAVAPAELREPISAYCAQAAATKAPATVKGIAGRLAGFGRFLATLTPPVDSLAELERTDHIEPWLAAVADARRADGTPISLGERRNRIITVSRFLADVTEWDWPCAPARRLLFARDVPRPTRPLPRYLPPDADRRLAAELELAASAPESTADARLRADALLLARATGLRIGELRDLELDCVHELAGHGAWLKVPLGKLASERMVPLDDPAVALVDRIAGHRTPGRPLPHPRTGQPVEFLLVYQGRRVSAQALRDQLARAGQAAGLGRVVPHELRHTYATALVNAGVSLQALMELLGHTSAAMSLRYGRLFDSTVRAEYERALAQAKARLGPMAPAASAPLPLVKITANHSDWRDAPAIKARLAGGFCVRAPAQGACPYANICEHCPNFRTDSGFLAVLGAQRADAERLAADADQRGWADEATRHRRLITRLDTLMNQAQ